MRSADSGNACVNRVLVFHRLPCVGVAVLLREACMPAVMHGPRMDSGLSAGIAASYTAGATRTRADFNSAFNIRPSTMYYVSWTFSGWYKASTYPSVTWQEVAWNLCWRQRDSVFERVAVIGADER